MPTYERSPQFVRDFQALSHDEREAFRKAVRKFVADLRSGGGFRSGLRVKGVQGAEGLFEMTFARDGRAIFSYGDSIHEGEPHIIWHAVGTHDIF